MALILKQEENGCLFGLWKLDETEEELSQAFSSAPKKELEQLKNFKNPNRRKERMATRLLVYELLGKIIEIEYDQYGKPHFVGDERSISISHTTGMVAVQICNKISGVDIEKISERVAKIAHKFLSPAELDQIELTRQLLHMYVYWCAKETVYKIYGKKSLDLKKHISVAPFDLKDEGSIKACLKASQEQCYQLDYFIFEAGEDNKYMVVKHS